MKKSLCVLFIIMGITGCVPKADISLGNGSTLSKEEEKQKAYEKRKNEELNRLEKKIDIFEKNSREALKRMGTTPQ